MNLTPVASHVKPVNVDTITLPWSNDYIDVYTKDVVTGVEIVLGRIEKDYFLSDIKPRLQVGKLESKDLRKLVKDKLHALNGNIHGNVDIFQNFILETGMIIDDVNIEKFALSLSSNKQTSFSQLLSDSFNVSKSLIETSSYFKEVVISEPTSRALHARVGAGELFIGFFSNGLKPKTGDIAIENHKIEIKGDSGVLLTNQQLINNKNFKKSRSYIFEKHDVDKNDTEAIDLITDLVIKITANDSKVNEIKDQLKQFISTNLHILLNERGKSKPSWVKLIGCSQLLVYQKIEKFNTLIVFNKNTTRGIKAAIINMNNTNLNDLFKTVTDYNIYFQIQYSRGGHKIKYK